jgi:hypothetical protein
VKRVGQHDRHQSAEKQDGLGEHQRPANHQGMNALSPDESALASRKRLPRL